MSSNRKDDVDKNQSYNSNALKYMDQTIYYQPVLVNILIGYLVSDVIYKNIFSNEIMISTCNIFSNINNRFFDPEIMFYLINQRSKKAFNRYLCEDSNGNRSLLNNSVDKKNALDLKSYVGEDNLKNEEWIKIFKSRYNNARNDQKIIARHSLYSVEKETKSFIDRNNCDSLNLFIPSTALKSKAKTICDFEDIPAGKLLKDMVDLVMLLTKGILSIKKSKRPHMNHKNTEVGIIAIPYHYERNNKNDVNNILISSMSESYLGYWLFVRNIDNGDNNGDNISMEACRRLFSPKSTEKQEKINVTSVNDKVINPFSEIQPQGMAAVKKNVQKIKRRRVKRKRGKINNTKEWKKENNSESDGPGKISSKEKTNTSTSTRSFKTKLMCKMYLKILEEMGFENSEKNRRNNSMNDEDILWSCLSYQTFFDIMKRMHISKRIDLTMMSEKSINLNLFIKKFNEEEEVFDVSVSSSSSSSSSKDSDKSIKTKDHEIVDILFEKYIKSQITPNFYTSIHNTIRDLTHISCIITEKSLGMDTMKSDLFIYEWWCSKYSRNIMNRSNSSSSKSNSFFKSYNSISSDCILDDTLNNHIKKIFNIKKSNKDDTNTEGINTINKRRKTIDKNNFVDSNSTITNDRILSKINLDIKERIKDMILVITKIYEKYMVYKSSLNNGSSSSTTIIPNDQLSCTPRWKIIDMTSYDTLWNLVNKSLSNFMFVMYCCICRNPKENISNAGSSIHNERLENRIDDLFSIGVITNHQDIFSDLETMIISRSNEIVLHNKPTGTNMNGLYASFRIKMNECIDKTFGCRRVILGLAQLLVENSGCVFNSEAKLMPNIFLYGPAGSGKDYLFGILEQMLIKETTVKMSRATLRANTTECHGKEDDKISCTPERDLTSFLKDSKSGGVGDSTMKDFLTSGKLVTYRFHTDPQTGLPMTIKIEHERRELKYDAANPSINSIVDPAVKDRYLWIPLSPPDKKTSTRVFLNVFENQIFQINKSNTSVVSNSSSSNSGGGGNGNRTKVINNIEKESKKVTLSVQKCIQLGLYEVNCMIRCGAMIEPINQGISMSVLYICRRLIFFNIKFGCRVPNYRKLDQLMQMTRNHCIRRTIIECFMNPMGVFHKKKMTPERLRSMHMIMKLQDLSISLGQIDKYMGIFVQGEIELLTSLRFIFYRNLLNIYSIDSISNKNKRGGRLSNMILEYIQKMRNNYVNNSGGIKQKSKKLDFMIKLNSVINKKSIINSTNSRSNNISRASLLINSNKQVYFQDLRNTEDPLLDLKKRIKSKIIDSVNIIVGLLTTKMLKRVDGILGLSGNENNNINNNKNRVNIFSNINRNIMNPNNDIRIANQTATTSMRTIRQKKSQNEIMVDESIKKQQLILKNRITNIIKSSCKVMDYNSSLSGYVRFSGSKDMIVENICNTLSYLNMVFGKGELDTKTLSMMSDCLYDLTMTEETHNRPTVDYKEHVSIVENCFWLDMKMLDYRIKSEIDLFWSTNNFSRKIYDLIDTQISNTYKQVMSFLSFGGNGSKSDHRGLFNSGNKKHYPLDAMKLVYSKMGTGGSNNKRRGLNNIIGVDIHLIYLCRIFDTSRKYWPFTKKLLMGDGIQNNQNDNIPDIDDSLWWITGEYKSMPTLNNIGSKEYMRRKNKMIRIWMNSFIPSIFFKPKMNESEILKCILREIMNFNRDKRSASKKNDSNKMMYRVERKKCIGNNGKCDDERGWNNVEYIEMDENFSKITYIPKIELSCKGYSEIIKGILNAAISQKTNITEKRKKEIKNQILGSFGIEMSNIKIMMSIDHFSERINILGFRESIIEQIKINIKDQIDKK